jgi:hypothetical protein
MKSENNMNTKLVRIGAVFYILWGVLHVIAGLQGFINPPEQAAVGYVAASLMQHSYNLIWFGVVSVIIAVFWIWRLDKTGYWMNLVLVSLADIGWLVFVVFPGHYDFVEGMIGPILWAFAVVFTTLGFRNSSRATE